MKAGRFGRPFSREEFLNMPHWGTLDTTAQESSYSTAPSMSCTGFIFVILGLVIVLGLFPLGIAFGISLIFKVSLINAFFGCLVIELVFFAFCRLLNA